MGRNNKEPSYPNGISKLHLSSWRNAEKQSGVISKPHWQISFSKLKGYNLPFHLSHYSLWFPPITSMFLSLYMMGKHQLEERSHCSALTIKSVFECSIKWQSWKISFATRGHLNFKSSLYISKAILWVTMRNFTGIENLEYDIRGIFTCLGRKLF